MFEKLFGKSEKKEGMENKKDAEKAENKEHGQGKTDGTKGMFSEAEKKEKNQWEGMDKWREQP